MDVSSQFVCTDLPPMPAFSEHHASFYKEAFSCKIRDWGATHVEHQVSVSTDSIVLRKYWVVLSMFQANSIAERCFRLSLDVAQVSADLKCSRSLVRTAEIKSTLVDHRYVHTVEFPRMGNFVFVLIINNHTWAWGGLVPSRPEI